MNCVNQQRGVHHLMKSSGWGSAAALLCLALTATACGAGSEGATGTEEDVDVAQSELILNVHNGVDDVWTPTERVNITYCVSTDFGSNYLRAVHEMHQATQDWEKAAYVNFVYKGEHDANCHFGDAPVTLPHMGGG
jgi:hypothetical protein